MPRKQKELIPGGLAPGGRCPRGIARWEIYQGIRVELEHTKRRGRKKPSKREIALAREIACDHLTEDRRYYRKLKKIHED